MKKRVWHLCSNRWNSAITEYALSSARAVNMAGYRGAFFAKAESPAAKRSLAHIQTVPLKSFSLRALPMLLEKAHKDPPELIFTYGGPETILALGVKAALGSAKVKVVRFRGQEVSSFGAVYRAKHRLSHTGVDAFLTPSVHIEAQLRRLGLQTPTLTVPLGCDEMRFSRTRPTPHDRPEMLVFGRFDPVKGHSAIISITKQILALWGDKPKRPCLHVVGEAANLSVADLEALVKAADLRLGHDVKITAARIADVPLLLSSATLGVVPSLGSEVICRVAEEFLLCGSPVAVSGAGSLEEVLFPGAGFSYRGLNVLDTASRFMAWIELSAVETEFDKAARSAAASGLFSLETMAKNIETVLALL